MYDINELIATPLELLTQEQIEALEQYYEVLELLDN